MKNNKIDLSQLTEQEKVTFDKIKDFEQFLTEKQYNELQRIVYKSLIKNRGKIDFKA